MISGVILAAGLSKRMEGKNKLMLELDQKKIVEHVIIAAKNSNLDELVLVYRDEAVKVLAEKYGIKALYNKNSEKGMATSLVEGVKGLSQDSKACLFMLGDMPFVSSDTINKIISAEELNISEKIVVPFYDGKRGNPVMIGRKYYEDILKNTGDLGAREIIKQNPEEVLRVDIEGIVQNLDIDTPQKYREIRIKN